MIQAVSLAAIRIVLVEPSHPGNIGAVARAMKNMALADLVLVRPKAFPHPEAVARASGADDLLARARVTGSVTDAVADCGFVAATTSRPRDQNFRALDLHDAAIRIFDMSERGPAAILFGAERTGLTNEELALAHLLIRIPANPEYPSLNLAMAAQVLCYELRMTAAGRPQLAGPTRDAPLATAAELEGLHEHLERLLTESGFLHPAHQKQVKLKLRRIFQRAMLDQNELSILRGMLTSLAPAKRLSSGVE